MIPGNACSCGTALVCECEKIMKDSICSHYPRNVPISLRSCACYRQHLEERINVKWYVRENDLIGGWCIMSVDEPPSLGIPEVADFLSKHEAEHIVYLHNRWLKIMED